MRGVTYGTFRPRAGSSFPPRGRVASDFDAMAACELNAVRTYDVPPRWLLDLAAERGLHVMVGVPWEQHVAFLDSRRRATAIADRVAEGVRSCAAHPAVLCYAIGNEIPASIVRWHGRQPVERFLERLYRVAKAEDPTALVTYVNYPSTEYLELSFLDLVCFNVFLESEPAFASYLARLQNIAGDRALLVTEAGLDSRSRGRRAQAEALSWQVRHSFATGAAGVFAFSWTDEWHRGGHDVLDWEFGVTDRQRRPKPSLKALREAFARVPFPPPGKWPRISVVVCTHNGERTLAECLDRLRALSYPDFEVIVVSDGSTDGTERIVGARRLALIRTDRQGLAAARNAGMEGATGEIVAYIDDDAYPDPDWLHYLAAAFLDGSHVAVGGPNVPPPDEGPVAGCVAAAPGGPAHVLIADQDAEHIPGCNMAFRRPALRAIGGFDPRFHAAGDDVDICWRLQDAGFTVGFSAGAVVFHRRRDSVRAYLRQQYAYGEAEALLERKWPNRHNRAGYLRWTGRVYGNGIPRPRRRKVRYGRWGTGLFQFLYQPGPSLLGALPIMPEAYLAIGALAALSPLGLLWSPLLVSLPLLALAILSLTLSALRTPGAAHAAAAGRSRPERARRRALTASLFMLQPLARLAGRLRHGLAPWRRRVSSTSGIPRPRKIALWSERWRSPESWLRGFNEGMDAGGRVIHGGAFDRWDLEVRGGPLGTARLRTAIEEHGRGKQLVRVRAWPRVSRGGLVATLAVAGLAVGAWLDGAPLVGVVLGISALALGASLLRDCSAALAVVIGALARVDVERAVP